MLDRKTGQILKCHLRRSHNNNFICHRCKRCNYFIGSFSNICWNNSTSIKLKLSIKVCTEPEETHSCFCQSHSPFRTWEFHHLCRSVGGFVKCSFYVHKIYREVCSVINCIRISLFACKIDHEFMQYIFIGGVTAIHYRDNSSVSPILLVLNKWWSIQI